MKAWSKQTWVLLAAAAVMAALWIRVFDRREWCLRQQSYVSYRPDLSRWLGLASHTAATDEVGEYLRANGLRPQDARNLRVAYRQGCLLLRFSLATPEMARLLRGKQRLRASAPEVLGVLARKGYVEAGDTITAFGFTREYPFVRLVWWPPSPAVSSPLVCYEGATTWHIPDAPDGLHYYLLVDQARGTVYLLGH